MLRVTHILLSELAAENKQNIPNYKFQPVKSVLEQ